MSVGKEPVVKKLNKISYKTHEKEAKFAIPYPELEKKEETPPEAVGKKASFELPVDQPDP